MGAASTELATRVSEALGMWMQDLECIEAGIYKLPWVSGPHLFDLALGRNESSKVYRLWRWRSRLCE